MFSLSMKTFGNIISLQMKTIDDIRTLLIEQEENTYTSESKCCLTH